MRIEMENDDERDKCPSRETLRKLAENPGEGGWDSVAAHLFACERCQRVFEGVLYPPEECSLNEEDLRMIDEFVSTRCRKYDPFKKLRAWIFLHPPVPRPIGSQKEETDFRKVAAKDSVRPKAADSEIVFLTYASFCGRASGRGWYASLALSASPSDKTRMPLTVMDADGCPVEGFFTVAGVRISLSCGHGEIAYSDFVAGLKSPDVGLELPDGTLSPGALVLF